MGLLTDDPAPVDARGGDGQKFIDLYWRDFDDEDRARVRRWAESGFTTSEIHRRIAQHYDIGRSTVERGLARLKAAGWES